jgi:hypothetical protein
MAIPPGLTCEQYYLYLDSGYTYSPLHGIMYLSSQVPSQEWISTVLHPHAFRPDETAFFLANRFYYDFGHRGWTRATFVKPAKVQERLWQEANRSQHTLARLQQKADEVINLMTSMTLLSNSTAPEQPVVSKKARPSACTTTRVKTSKTRERVEKGELRKVQLIGSKQRSRRSQAVKEKVKTMPASLPFNRGYWQTVL